MPETNQPIYATMETHVNFTHGQLHLFGRVEGKTFSGKGHKARAAAWMTEWNEHFDREWFTVRDTGATIMDVFVKALQAEGVGERTVNSAMAGALKTVKAHAQG